VVESGQAEQGSGDSRASRDHYRRVASKVVVTLRRDDNIEKPTVLPFAA
jgi:hypothetical protein